MSKSLGNYIAITDPPSEMFGKIMRVPDQQMGSYFELLTDLPESEIPALIDPSKCNPRDSKEKLAKIIITKYHSADAADTAAEEFRRVHGGQGGGLPDEIPEIIVPAGKVGGGMIDPVDLTTHCAFADSRGEARRLIAERGVRVNGEVIADAAASVPIKNGDIVQRGKRRFVRLVIE
jgi:tyrosyl-tRNA synthetase